MDKIPVLPEKVEDRPQLKLYEKWMSAYTKEELVFVVTECYHLDQLMVNSGAVPDMESFKNKYLQHSNKMIDLLNQHRIPRIDNIIIQDAMLNVTRVPMSEEELKLQSEISNWKIDLSTNPSMVSSEMIASWKTELDFKLIKHYLHIEGGLGSAGVFILDLENRGLLVLKEGTKAEAVVVAHLIAQEEPEFRNAFKVPQARLVNSSSSHFRVLFDRLYELEPWRTRREGHDMPKFKRMSKLGQFLIMEFIVGTGICNISETVDFKAKVFQPEELRAVGKAVLFDMILNNWDRVPIKGIWNNDGNPSNLMFKIAEEKEQCQVILIDQIVNSIKLAKNRQTYMDNLRKFALNAIKQLEAFNNLSEEEISKKDSESGHTVMASLREFLQFNTVVGYDIGFAGELEVLKGFVEAVKSPSFLPADSLTRIQEIADRLCIHEVEGLVFEHNEVVRESVEFVTQCVQHLKEGVSAAAEAVV
eukprot:TRINITY_DN3072_c0_g1_i2.p1 TRINITY_DN3072_c0_g1~~TRINITY_DN3072_c0_g1_i2.p1  ORF type:complete len:474 (+),score=138.34 TRINITY_DN3072_c0_g1_i2:14-1435(+)